MLADDIEFSDHNGFDWGEPGGRPLGCNERQIKFAQAILRGCNRTQAAREAGYGGDDRALRSQGHRTFHSPKIQALLRMAQAAEEGEEPDGTPEELRKILWREARHGTNPTSKIRAAELLARHCETLRPEHQLERASDLDLIHFLEDMSANPFWSAMIVLIAQDFPCAWGSDDEKQVRAYRMPRRAWEGLRRHYPAVTEILQEKGCGGCREDEVTG